MMRFALQQLRYTPAMTANGVTQAMITGLNRPLVDAINNGLTRVVNRDPVYRRWFGGMAARRATVMANMTRMRNFANGHATLSLVSKPASEFGAESQAYAWPQGGRSVMGQYLLNIGVDFGTLQPLANGVLAHYTVRGECLRTIAHEACHLIFGANIAPPCPANYTEEHYLLDAVALAGDDPDWAAWNADNYAYFIENCS